MSLFNSTHSSHGGPSSQVSGVGSGDLAALLDDQPLHVEEQVLIDVGVDTVDDVRRKGRALEGAVLSRAVQLYLNNEIVIINGKVVFKPGMRTLIRDMCSE